MKDMTLLVPWYELLVTLPLIVAGLAIKDVMVKAVAHGCRLSSINRKQEV